MKKEIYLFPNAGGTIEFFNDLCGELQQGFICYPFEYPGHGTDTSEFCDTAEQLSFAAYEFYKTRHHDSTDVILMGYSMGTIIAMELLELLGKYENETPIGIVLAADPPVNMIFEDADKSEEENIKFFYMKNGDISEKLINSKLFGRLYLPSFRNDYHLLKSFDYTTLLKRKNGAKSLIFYCEEDTPYQIMCGWREYFTNEPQFRRYSGGHFFLKKHYIEIADVIKMAFQEDCEREVVR